MILECLKLAAAAEGVQQDLAYNNLLLKAFKCVGKGRNRASAAIWQKAGTWTQTLLLRPGCHRAHLLHKGYRTKSQ